MRWKRVANADPQTAATFPWRIMEGSKVVALVTSDAASKRIAGIQLREQALEDDVSRMKILYLSAAASRSLRS